MVSFSCEVCNDTLVKRKLIPHFNRCPNAYFTCIDCNTTFQGDEFQGHTSCISEDQKYQGKLYKGKDVKAHKAKVAEPEVSEPKASKKASEAKELKKSGKASDKQQKSKREPTKIDVKSSQSLYKVIKGLKKTHKLDTKELLKKITVTPEGALELA